LISTMKRKSPLILKLSYLILIFGLLFIGLEYILENYFKTSICPTSGCFIASELLLLGKNNLLILALLFYTALVFLLFLYQKTEGSLFKNLLLYLLTAGLIGDAYLIFFLFINIAEPCWFCLIVFSITLAGAISILIYIRDEPITSPHFLVALAFGMFSLALGFYISSPSPIILKEGNVKKASFILIYSQHCPACKEVIAESERLGLKLEKVPLNQAYPLVKSLNLKSLPCLLEFKEDRIEIYTGFEAVKKRLNLEEEQNPCVENPQEGGLCAIP
jgi:uncharacterized membrane protein/glutaredoxin-related protein